MGHMIIANAPVSFGIFEPEFGETQQMPYERVLAAIAEAGYEGTELGPYGYLPTDPRALQAALKQCGLRLGSSFVPVALADESLLEEGCKKVLAVGSLLHSQGVGEVIVADTGDARRKAEAGRQPRGWTDAQWHQAARAFEVLAERLHAELGMRIVVHHHAGTYLETPQEIERLLACTHPERVGLLLDTGHYAYGGGDPVALLDAHGSRVWYMHYKDIDRQKLEAVRHTAIDLPTAWRSNIFVPLGKGSIDFAAITARLRKMDYSGWIVVEQDVVADDTGAFDIDPVACAKESRAYLRTLGL